MSELTYPLFRIIAQTVQARINCDNSVNTVWFNRHGDFLEWIEKNLLPSGSGIDSGTTIDLVHSTAEKIVLHTSYHHMNEGGYYDGWTKHKVTIRPSLISTIDLTISGRDRNQIKDYLHDVFYTDLTTEHTLKALHELSKR